MADSRRRGLAVLAAGALFLYAFPRNAGPDSTAFTTAVGHLPTAVGQPRALTGATGDACLKSFCGSFDDADACARNLERVAMQSQGQGGRNIYAKMTGCPRLKGAKKMAVLRPRKHYGSHGARKVPRRYPLYDILEEIDERIPTYTVLTEPEDPYAPREKVALVERYPWAGSLAGVNKKKQDMEHGENDERMEPLFGSWTGAGLPPTGRRQRYILHTGFPTYNLPPFLNRPLIGEGVKVTGNMEWKKHRAPEPWQLTSKKRRELALKDKEDAKERLKEAMVVDDSIDAALDAMGSD
ncbi:unnamed protein product [Polarella glacialis]|uniref:Uncharacterized protein n=1 Tax=Polarella glacialis TaxID=89957 RepID=A0A813HSN6_POLGL|nr:unnamed protein product [Polarella glacialis]